MFAILTARLRTGFGSLLALTLLAAVALSLAPARSAAAAERGFVTAQELNVRTGPGTQFMVTAILHQGAALTIYDSNAAGDWLYISYSEGDYWGWVSALHVQRTAATVALEVVNYSSETVYYLYVSPSTSTDWGVDQLGTSGIILPGESFVLTVPAGEYDFKAVNAAGLVIATDYHQQLYQAGTWFVYDQ